MARPRKRNMSRRSKRQPRRPPRTGAALVDDLVRDTAARFTCSTKTLSNFLYQCDADTADLDCDILYNDVAAEIWKDHSADLANVLADFAAERKRHLATLADIRRRLAALDADTSLDHLHLDPVENYRALIRSRVFGDHPHG